MKRCGVCLAVALFWIALAWAIFLASPVVHAQEDWTRLDGPVVPGGAVLALAVAPSQPDTLYTLVDHPLGVRLFRSEDRALSWTQVATVSTIISPMAIWLGQIPVLVVDAGDSQTLYLTNGNGAFRSSDGGVNWTQVLTTGVYLAAPAPSLIFVLGRVAGETPDCAVSWLFARSEDAGDHWQRTELSCLGPVEAMAVADTDPHAIFLTVSSSDTTFLVSKDRGRSWLVSRALPVSGKVIAANPTDPDHLLVGGYGGEVLQSRDGGQSWVSLMNAPLRYFLEIDEILFAADGTAYIAAARFGFELYFDEWIPVLYRSDDAGRSWWMATEPMPDRALHLAVAPDNSSLLYAWTQGKGVFRSTSGGHAWQEQNNGLRSPVIVDAIEPRPDGVIYVAASRFSRGRNGLFRSDDGGLSWTAVLTDTPPIQDVVAHPQAAVALAVGGGKLYQGYPTPQGMAWELDSLWASPVRMVVQSADLSAQDPDVRLIGGWSRITEYQNQGGVGRWHAGGAGVAPGWELIPIKGAAYVNAVLIDPTTPARMYASVIMSDTSSPIFRSDDGGATWHQVAAPTNEYGVPYRIDQFYAANGRLYSTDFGILLFSDDHGESWQAWSSRSTDGYIGDILDLAVAKDGQLFVAADNGAYRWNPRLDRWEPLGLPTGDVTTLAVVQEKGQELLYVGSVQGIWKRSVPPSPVAKSRLPWIGR